MKKATAFVLISILMASMLAACGAGQTGGKTASGSGNAKSGIDQSAFAAFQKVQQNMKGIEDATFRINWDAEFHGGNSMSVIPAVQASGTQIFHESGGFDLAMKVGPDPAAGAQSQGGISLAKLAAQYSLYKKGSEYYVDFADGEKIKMKDPGTDGLPFYDICNAEKLMDITPGIAASLKSSEEPDGTEYDFSLDPSKSLDYFYGCVAYGGQMTELYKDVRLTKMDVSIVVGSDGMAKSIETDCSLAIKIKAGDAYKAAKMKFLLSMEYAGINTGSKIKFPDFSRYKQSWARAGSGRLFGLRAWRH